MPYIQIQPHELLNPTVPGSLAPFIEPAVWQLLIRLYDESAKEVACSTGCIVCITCSWCCQDSILWSMMSSGSLPKRLRAFNKTHFLDKPVVQVKNDQFVIQSDYILEFQEQRLLQSMPMHQGGGHMLPMPLPMAQAELAPMATAMHMPQQYPPHSSPPMQFHPANQPPMPSPVQQRRKMDVIVPPGAPPGSVLSVQDANGQIVQVTVPPGVVAGMKLEFEY